MAANPGDEKKVPPKTGVEDQLYYHGMRSRKDIEALLPNEGDYLVRATDGRIRKIEIILSIRNSKNVSHLTLSVAEGKWSLGMLQASKKLIKFNSVLELVDYYRTHKLGFGLTLKNPVSRPLWLMKHDQVKYKDSDHLGNGNFCAVFRGVYHKDNQKIDVAVKICHAMDPSKFEEQRKEREMMVAEAKSMSMFMHTHVVQSYGVACDRPPVLIVMEFCPGGSLDKHLERQKAKIEIGERLVYVIEAARGMKYLHTKNCVHRDLAARNCLISAQGYIKIADFGLSVFTDGSKNEEIADGGKAQQIPVRWMAPESLKTPRKYSIYSDVWSFGVLCYEIFNDGKKPFLDDPPKKIATNIRKGKMPELPEKMPSDLMDLVKEMWNLDDTERPNFRELSNRLKKLVKVIPVPKAADFTVNSIKGVTRSIIVKDNEDDMTDNTNKESVDNAAPPKSDINKTQDAPSLEK